MSQKKIEKQTIQMTENSTTYKMIIPKKVEEKIIYICRKVWKDEWSGVLFFTSEGSFEDRSLIIKCEDICVMDTGSSAYTEFDMSPDVCSYVANNPELLDCHMGLIHSHNNMDTFFSGTDIRTLKEEGLDRNHFVSLIVNNRGNYTAAITRRLVNKCVVESFCYPSFGNTQIKEVRNFEGTNTEELEYYYLDIEVEGRSEYTELESRLKEIEESKIREINSRFDPPLHTYKPFSKFESLTQKDTYNLMEEDDLSQRQQTLKFRDDTKKHSFDKGLAKSLALQLVTGSVVIPRESKINIKSWVAGMIPIYERRFGKGEEGLEMFKKWAEGFIEFLCWYTIDEDLVKQGVDDDEIVTLCATAIKEELEKLDSNIYIEECIKILSDYIF